MTAPKGSKATRKARSDSQQEQVRAMMGSSLVLNPPDGMCKTKEQDQMFQEVIAEFANVDWTPHTVRLAAHLAQSLSLYKQAQEELISEGLETTSANGNPMPSPYVNICNALNGQILANRRSLSLQSTGRAVDKGKSAKQRKEAQMNAPNDKDNLINRPTVS